MSIKVKSAGAWADVSQPYVKDEGIWQPCKKVLVKDEGAWMTAWEPAVTGIPWPDPYDADIVEMATGYLAIGSTGQFNIPLTWNNVPGQPQTVKTGDIAVVAVLTKRATDCLNDNLGAYANPNGETYSRVQYKVMRATQPGVTVAVDGDALGLICRLYRQINAPDGHAPILLVREAISKTQDQATSPVAGNTMLGGQEIGAGVDLVVLSQGGSRDTAMSSGPIYSVTDETAGELQTIENRFETNGDAQTALFYRQRSAAGGSDTPSFAITNTGKTMSWQNTRLQIMQPNIHGSVVGATALELGTSTSEPLLEPPGTTTGDYVIVVLSGPSGATFNLMSEADVALTPAVDVSTGSAPRFKVYVVPSLAAPQYRRVTRSTNSVAVTAAIISVRKKLKAETQTTNNTKTSSFLIATPWSCTGLMASVADPFVLWIACGVGVNTADRGGQSPSVYPSWANPVVETVYGWTGVSNRLCIGFGQYPGSGIGEDTIQIDQAPSGASLFYAATTVFQEDTGG